MNCNPIITKIEKDYSGAFFFYQYTYLRDGEVKQISRGCYGSGSDEMVIELVSKETGRPAVIDFEVRYQLAGVMAHRMGERVFVGYLLDEWRPQFPGRITHIDYDVLDDAEIGKCLITAIHEKVYCRLNSGKLRQADGKAAGEFTVEILNRDVQWVDSPTDIFERGQPRYVVDL